MLIVDMANVVGSRPDGWWRDRPRAAGELVERVRRAVDRGDVPHPVVLVLEGSARRGADEGRAGGVEVVHAPGEGDDTVVALAEQGPPPLTVVSADRRLRERVRHLGAEVVGPDWLLARLDRLDRHEG